MTVLREAIILVREDEASAALVCLNSADLGDANLSGYVFGIDDDVPFLESPDGSDRYDLPRDSYAAAVLAMGCGSVVLRSMDLDADRHRDFALVLAEEAPSAGPGAR